ncbi:MAG: hypothetical protein QM765_00900 [Myxococcales bacterium]
MSRWLGFLVLLGTLGACRIDTNLGDDRRDADVAGGTDAAVSDASHPADAQATDAEVADAGSRSDAADATLGPDAGASVLGPCESMSCDGAGGCTRAPKPKATYCGNNSWCDGVSTICPPGTSDWETAPGSHFYWARPHPMGEDLYGLWSGASDDVWAVGSHGVALHWDGNAWSRVETGTQERLHDVFGFSPNDVWAVGTHDTLLHWDGVAWSPIVTGFSDSFQYLGVWGRSSSSDLWVVGFSCGPDGPFAASDNPPVVIHWDGARWMEVEVPLHRHGFNAITGSTTGDAWLVGPYETLKWDAAGTFWSVLAGSGGITDVWADSSGELLERHRRGERHLPLW